MRKDNLIIIIVAININCDVRLNKTTYRIYNDDGYGTIIHR